jgi:ABC-2 type transport system permease protein
MTAGVGSGPAVTARAEPRAEVPPEVGPGGPGFARTVAAVYRGQLAAARSARGPLLFVATVQSVGIELLLRGVADTHHWLTRESIVAGATVLVVAYLALNVLAQRLGAWRHAGALDHYAALPVPASAVALGVAASYASLAVPGAVLTALVGAGLFGLSFVHLWLLVPVVVLGGAALAGLGAVLGLLAPRPELATLFGQLAMTVVLFAGVIPADRLPALVRPLRAVIPSTYAVDALALGFHRHPDWWSVGWHLLVCAAVAAAALALAGPALRRAVGR